MKNLRVALAMSLVAVLFVTAFFLAAGAARGQEAASAGKPVFTWREVMIPVRDGVHLQTVIIAPAEQKEALPILFRRTPYGVPEKAPEQMPGSWKELMADGYIMVIQNLRGRFKSEGNFDLTGRGRCELYMSRGVSNPANSGLLTGRRASVARHDG